ncbi:MAG: hypothetical protein FJ290_09150 [Planctomycetes bacterium]|nr:hypothetical protein [Planctomycetota bacterium]
MKALARPLLALCLGWCFAGEGADPLARLRSLEKIRDAAAIEAECRSLLKSPLGPDQRAAVYKALFGATTGDKRIAALKELPPDFPEKEGIELFVAGIRDSEAYRSLDYYKLMLVRYGDKVTAEVVDRAARPLLNERRDWIEGAEAVVKAALERFPGDPRLLDILADAYRRSRRGKESLDLQRQAIQNATTPELKKAMYERLARNLRLQRMDAEALQVPLDIVREWPDSDWARDALGGLALARLRSDGIEPARKVYLWYVETYPKGKWVEHCHLSLLGLYQLDGQYDAAAEEMKRIRPLVSPRAQANLDRDLAGMPSIAGQVLDERGRPVPNATVALARLSPIREEKHLILARTKSDGEGRYAFRSLPYHVQYEFLAATKPDDPPTCLSTTFGPKTFPLELNDRKTMDIRFGRTPLKRLPDPALPEVAFDDVAASVSLAEGRQAGRLSPQGRERRCIRTFVLRDWTGRPWPRSPLHYAIELPRRVKPSSLRLVDLHGLPVPFQFMAGEGNTGTLTFFSSLPASGMAAYFLFGGDQEAKPPQFESNLSVKKAEGNTLEVSSGVASFRVPAGPPRPIPPAMHVSSAPAPIFAVKGPDGVWRGKGSLIGRGQVTRMASTWVEDGPLMRRLRLEYGFEEGGAYEATLTFLSGEPYVLVAEKCRGLSTGEFRFSVFADFQPNRAALCWINKLHVQAISCQSRRNLIQMHRYIMWAPPGEGDAAGFFRDTPDANDLITCFTIHPGDWLVQSQERWRAATFGDKSRWNGDPHAGGRDSIDAFEEKGDAHFSYPFFAGERRWGLAVTPKDDAPNKAADLRACVGETTLDWYKDLVLDWDEEPLDSHPRLVVPRDRLAQVARALKTDPLMKLIAEPRRVQHFQSLFYERPPAAIEFLFTGDPERAWAVRDCTPRGDCVPGVRAGKMRSNIWSPVPIRGFPYSSADVYDALANSNIHDEAALRTIRARMMFVAYALDSGDFMAWRYHAGHRNFDFSRLDALTAFALCFPTHPDAPKLVERAINQFRESLIAFTSDVSGKWQENLGCYYLWSLRTAAAMNARLLNCRWSRYDPFGLPKHELFLRFAARTVTPEHPLDDNVCIDGLPAGKSYADVSKGRRHPGVGDHGGEGGHSIQDGIGLYGLVAARAGRRDLARDLLGAWKAGGFDISSKAGIDIKGHLIAQMDSAFVEKATMKSLASENLPQYGFCFRGAWGTGRESYLLFKCGTGGYRYHASEGSFVLYARNRPLSLDGDENFIPARHATLTLGSEHRYLGNGRVERFALDPAADYCRGVFPDAKAARTIVFAKNHYFAIRDDAEDTSNFVLPLLVHRIERRGSHFFCPGRLGLDVLLYPLGKEPAKVEIATDPLLNQQRLTLTRPAGDGHLNLITWGEPLDVKPFGPGYHIKGTGFEDYLFLTPQPVQFHEGKVAFDGRSGLIRLGGPRPVLLLFDGTRIAFGGKSVQAPR